jgi:hypothetical protein
MALLLAVLATPGAGCLGGGGGGGPADARSQAEYDVARDHFSTR